MSDVPIANGFYNTDSRVFSSQRCINLIPCISEVPSLSKEYLIGAPGIKSFLTTGTVLQSNRGSKLKKGVPYFVNGATLYKVTRELVGSTYVYATVAIGTIEGFGPVSMAASSSQLMILVPGGKGYIHDDTLTPELQEITDPDFRANGNPTYCVFLSAVFVCTTDQNKAIQSDINNGLSWSSLNYATAESDPDDVVAPVVTNNQLFITGSNTTEGFVATASSSTFLFDRTGIFLDKGCCAPFSIVRTNQTFLMIGNGENESPAVWEYNKTEFVRVSNSAVEELLYNATVSELANAKGLYLSHKGSFLVVFTIGSNTVCYDLATKRWSELSSYVNESLDSWRVTSIVTAYNKVLVGDAVDGRIGELSFDEYAEYGEEIHSILELQPFFSEEGMTVPKLEFVVETGVGNSIDPDPKMSLEISRDGVIFGQPRNVSIGQEGEYSKRVVWRQNGSATRLLKLRFKITARVKKVLIKLVAK